MQIGPALSALDADVSYQAGPVQKAKDYKRAAQHSAAAQEARGMLGERARPALTAPPDEQQTHCLKSCRMSPRYSRSPSVDESMGRCAH